MFGALIKMEKFFLKEQIKQYVTHVYQELSSRFLVVTRTLDFVVVAENIGSCVRRETCKHVEIRQHVSHSACSTQGCKTRCQREVIFFFFKT